jgi:hypothetical protein
MELAKHVMLPGQEPGEIKYKGKWYLLGDGGRRECAEGGNCSQLPPSLRPVIPLEAILKRAA